MDLLGKDKSQLGNAPGDSDGQGTRDGNASAAMQTTLH
jgi:hypothetical protein